MEPFRFFNVVHSDWQDIIRNTVLSHAPLPWAKTERGLSENLHGHCEKDRFYRYTPYSLAASIIARRFSGCPLFIPAAAVSI